MADSKWKLFEYEYSVAEFVISFVIAFVLAYIFLSSTNPVVYSLNPFLAAGVVALVLAAIWTYLNAVRLFNMTDKEVQQS